MTKKLALTCLAGTLLLLCNSAPASIKTNPPAAAFIHAAAADHPAMAMPELGEPLSSATDLAPLKGPLPDDSPALEQSKDPGLPTSLERARAALAESNAPALSRQEICTRIAAVAQANELPIGFFANLIWRESQFDHEAISRVGAMGIAQFMPDVADRLGLNAFDARDALPASGRLLRTLRARFGNLGLVAAAYNAGPKRVLDWLQQRGGLPQETRDYVGIVTGRPVEQWREGKAKTVVFNVPRHVPCHRITEFAEVEQAERAAQLRKIAEEQKAIEAARESLRRQKNNKARKTVIASRGRSS
jgi:hypothetical protein